MHALLRIQGIACTRIPKNIINVINNQIDIYYPYEHLAAGLYLLQSNNNGSTVLLNKIDTSAVGSHEALWAQLDDQIKHVSTIALRDTVDPDAGRDLAMLIDRFTIVINYWGGPSWLSLVS